MFLILSSLLALAFICFCIYFNFKVLQFVVQAINLYKSMITRQDMIIKLLKDIKVGHKNNRTEMMDDVTDSEILDDVDKNEQTSSYCTSCGAKIDMDSRKCVACGIQQDD